MKRILAIDPGGRTGIFFTDGQKEEFLEINKPWKEAYQEIKEIVKERKINLVILENTNFLNHRSKDSLNLIRLLGAIECLSVKEIKSVNVLKVKEMSKLLLNGKIKIDNLDYQIGRGKGWMWKNKRISIHQLEAYLVYYLTKII